MTTFEKGTRVRINDTYATDYKDSDGTVKAIVGELGTVTDKSPWYVEVLLDNEAHHMPWGEHMFKVEELDILEEAHPL